MKISIIIPIYQVKDYIKDCINSVLAQDYQDFECLLIDDGTKDNSIDIAEELIKEDSRFIIYHKENGGLSDARNYGLNKATGEYVFFLDSDDMIATNTLSSVVEVIDKDSDIICFDMEYFYEDGRKEISKGGLLETASYPQNKELLYYNNSANNKFFRRLFLMDKNFIKGMWYEDLAVIPVWMALAKKVKYIPKPLYLYRQRAGSISHSADSRIFDIYKALANIQNELHIEANEIAKLYLRDGFMMTTYRIKDFEDPAMRLSYYENNINHLESAFKDWYQYISLLHPSFKQKIIFFLLKKRQFKLVDRLFRR